MAQAKLALFARLHAKSGKEDELAQLLQGALQLAHRESGTTTWFALRFDRSTFGIFDTFADEQGRDAHLNGQIAAALMQKAPELLAEDPHIEKVDVLAAKLP
jgi:quinol monooxygenase YgiN